MFESIQKKAITNVPLLSICLYHTNLVIVCNQFLIKFFTFGFKFNHIMFLVFTNKIYASLKIDFQQIDIQLIKYILNTFQSIFIKNE